MIKPFSLLLFVCVTFLADTVDQITCSHSQYDASYILYTVLPIL